MTRTLCWTAEHGGQATSGVLATSLPPGACPVDVPGWRGLQVDALEYVPGTRYRMSTVGYRWRDLAPAEMQSIDDWLAALERKWLAAIHENEA